MVLAPRVRGLIAGLEATKNWDTETKPTPNAPTKGQAKQNPARCPITGHGSGLSLLFARAKWLRLVVCWETVLTQMRQSDFQLLLVFLRLLFGLGFDFDVSLGQS